MADTSDTKTKKLTANVKAAGCAAKMSSAELKQVLSAIPQMSSPEVLAGIDNFEDAAVYKISEDLAIVQTIDFFPPVVDDPFLFGQIAATNALSDVYAMGGKPILALNVLCFPTCDFPLAVVGEILRGGQSKVAEAGAILVGGHSIQSSEPIYGLSVTGVIHPDKILTNCGARDGDAMILTKPLGAGVGLLGMKGGELSKPAEQALLSNLTELNNKALDVALRYSIHAATDITGFGLIGHLSEMAQASGLKAIVDISSIEFLPEVKALAEQGFVPAGAYGNRKSFEPNTTYINDVDLAVSDLLFDPQTSGGLLFALDASVANELLQDLKRNGHKASLIGTFSQGERGMVEVRNGK